MYLYIIIIIIIIIITFLIAHIAKLCALQQDKNTLSKQDYVKTNKNIVVSNILT